MKHLSVMLTSKIKQFLAKSEPGVTKVILKSGILISLLLLLLLFLKAARLDASFDFDGKLFQSVAPLNEKLLCPLEDIFFGNLRSVVVRLRL